MLGDALKETFQNEVLHTYSPIDYVFIDGHHDEKATVAYYEQIAPCLSERAVLVFDNIAWSDGMKRAWKTIQNSQRVKISVEMEPLGICLIDTRIKRNKSFTIKLI